MFAVLNVNKPAGPTSHDVVAKVRRVFGLKKVGHLGSLDPVSTGVLPVCLGQATRLIEYFPTDKAYRAEITLGKTTTTLDREGEFLTETPCGHLTHEAIETALQGFLGTIDQVVPFHSAVHVGGKKLYEYAHKGLEAPPLPSRQVTFYQLTLVEIQRSVHPDFPVLIVDLTCSSGTYIRSLARDLGEALGCGAYLSGLTRTVHGKFQLSSAVSLEELVQDANPSRFLEDPTSYLDLPMVSLSTMKRVGLLANGIKLEPIPSEGRVVAGKPYIVTYEGLLLAVVQLVGGRLKPLKIFSENLQGLALPSATP